MISCLVIVDVQKGFLVEETKHVPNKIKELLLKHKFDHIVTTKYINHIGSACEKQLNWTLLMDEESQKLDPYIESVSEKSFEKDIYTCFTEEFEEYLKKENITKLYFAGVDTDCCVLASVFDAFDKGYDYGIFEDCCASCGGVKAHQAAMGVFERSMGANNILKI